MVTEPFTILVVDDDPHGRELLREIFEIQGWKAMMAADGIEATEILSREPVDFIVSDILMPRMDGFQLCRFVKSHGAYQNIGFVFYTGDYTGREDEQFAFSLGASCIVTKPVAPGDLVRIVEAARERKPHTKPPRLTDGDSFLAEHNLRLFQKLEDKVKELEETSRKLAASEASLLLYTRHLEELVEERTRALMQSQEILSRQERLAYLSHIAGDVSHELRVPLATIANAGYYLQATLYQNDETAREYLEIIISEIQRVNRIIHNLLDITAVRFADRSFFSFLSVLRAVIEKNPAPPGVHLRIEATPDLPPVYADPDQVSQIISNIIANAFQAMSGGGTIRIELRAANEEMNVSFSDTGCGIPADMLDKIFEPLVSLSGKGSGLGLPLARNLAELNDGSLRADSNADGGARFTLTLPLGGAVASKPGVTHE